MDQTGHHSPTTRPPGFAIVGIGASAGGLTALRTFFENVPEDSGLAFVVVVHLAAESESVLANLLQATARIPVRQVVETILIEPNQVYVIPPGRNLKAVDSHLRLSVIEPSRRDRAPIDYFFRTLARTYDGVSIGVILSGTGSDGTLGIKEIKHVGGLAVVQDPREADYDGMPHSAIATGLVDRVLSVAEIPGTILRYVRTRPGILLPPGDGDVDSNARQILIKLLSQVRTQTGRDFTRYKRSTLMRRIQRRMQLHQIERFDDYLAYVRAQPDEAHAVADEFLVTVTNFFRDAEVFHALEKEVIPQLFDLKSPDDNIRVWTVGCATGEEAYSIVMLCMEEAARREQPPMLQVFASDLHERSLKTAREGLYPGNIEADVPAERLRRFFIKETNGYRVRRELRDLVVFAPHNLLSDPPFSKVDLISCRNLLIYLQPDVQREVIELFHYALRPDGVLVLGTSETVGSADLFRVEDKNCCVYRKRNVPTPDSRLPVFAPVHPGQLGRLVQRPPMMESPTSYSSLHTQMIERHAQPSVLLNQNHEVVHLSPGAGRYLRMPGGELVSNVFRLLHEELRLELRTALHTAEKERRRCRTKPVIVDLDGQPHRVVVEVWPAEHKQYEGLALLVFEELPAEQDADDEQAAIERGEVEGVRELYEELEQTKQRLQGLIEQYETGQEEMKASNEELQSANEELRATMEELETSKEELQSMNEELSTLNQENRYKVEELSELSSDLENLLAATEIATLFLDREMRILRFTPRVGELFNMRITDRGRPLSDLTHRLSYPELTNDARSVLRDLAPLEREIQDHNDRWYLARLLPYRTADDHIGGVVLTLIEISERKRAELAQLVRAESDAFRLKLTDAIRPLVDPLEVQSVTARLIGEYLGANRVFYAELSPSRELGEVRVGYHAGVAEVIGEYHFDDHGPTLVNELSTGRTVIVTNVQEDARLGPIERARAQEQQVKAFVSVPVVKHAQALGVSVFQQSEPRKWTRLEVALMEESVERMWTAAERVQAANSLRESEERYRTLFEEGFCMIEVLFGADDTAIDYRFVETNPVFEAQTGIENAVGRRMRELAPSHEAHWFETFGRVAKTGEPARFEAGAKAFGRFYDVHAFRVGVPEQHRVAVLFKDITERRQLEDQLSDANRRKDEFLATLAHELRNPLASITNVLALLNRPEKKNDAEALHAIINRQIRQLVRLVDDLLDLSRITRGVIELHRQPLDLHAVIRTALETSRPQLERGGRQLSVGIPDQPVVVDGDQTRLVQIIANLLNNAAKFTDEGGRIWLTLGREGDYARLSVRDDGMGIPAGKLEKVFEMFTQLESTRAEGLGIGLTLVRSLVELHGGSIEVRSEGPGRGSEFIMKVPLCKTATASVPEEPAAPELTDVQRSCRTLVVDDNHDAADTLASLLGILGVEVEVAYDGPAALAICHRWVPRLVFLDLGLPGMDGFDIARALRKLPEGSAMHIVALTGLGQAKDREHAHEAGFDEHLVKPVLPETLEAVLGQYCR